ncbi:gamma-glutamyl-gamma-aminobutyrate hydrolase family protein [Atopobium sp. oral taxon 416]|uniref:gamma-glutamyl-gamma-aminobutyrate hydrolase family protein n=1 Tax=Atopobium sp. oral taxon 416 TaxID=712157 RepID=UPI001BAC4DF6|nr:gamma-glutamyl-gamma-aminobutyrate hydrolase family protein [Atopobium sp. oral taxon 416]QUC02600.1 gamma-glutamyl-gamma-aminobutyrate hydrolase family protein [Atopobium sp. oral taxon 416]
MKPIVCITPSIFEGPDKEHKLINMKYTSMMKAVGMLPILCDYDDDPSDVSELLDRVQGLILTGGFDMDPGLYGQRPLPNADAPHPERDNAEFELLREALDRDMPVLGICRGVQVLNVLLGGSLWQDVNEQGATDFKHSIYDEPEKDVHKVTLLADTPIAEAVGKRRLLVNSCHHQAIRELSPVLTSAGYSHDGLIEAVYMPGRTCVWGVQWHPESLYLNHPEEFGLAKGFAQNCRAYASHPHRLFSVA